MKKIFFISIITLLSTIQTSPLFAQDFSLSKVPKQISVEFGYRNSFYQNTGLTNDATITGLPNNAINGYGLLVDYAWQLSGFDGKKPAIFLSIPIGYSVLLPSDATSRMVSMLNYGWTIRHELTKNRKIVPFIGYGLFLNNLKPDGIDGSVTGHQTQFEGGVNFNTTKRLKYFVKLQCSYSSYPKLNYAKSLHFMYADLRVGVRF